MASCSNVRAIRVRLLPRHHMCGGGVQHNHTQSTQHNLRHLEPRWDHTRGSQRSQIGPANPNSFIIPVPSMFAPSHVSCKQHQGHPVLGIPSANRAPGKSCWQPQSWPLQNIGPLGRVMGEMMSAQEVHLAQHHIADGFNLQNQKERE